jgi:hypothetical protein
MARRARAGRGMCARGSQASGRPRAGSDRPHARPARSAAHPQGARRGCLTRLCLSAWRPAHAPGAGPPLTPPFTVGPGPLPPTPSCHRGPPAVPERGDLPGAQQCLSGPGGDRPGAQQCRSGGTYPARSSAGAGGPTRRAAVPERPRGGPTRRAAVPERGDLRLPGAQQCLSGPGGDRPGAQQCRSGGTYPARSSA